MEPRNFSSSELNTRNGNNLFRPHTYTNGSYKLVLLFIGLAILVSIPATYLALKNPYFLHLNSLTLTRGIAGAAAFLLVCYVILKYPGIGLYILISFVYLNLSQVLVRYHKLPSLLQSLMVPMFIAAWTRRFLVNKHRLSIGSLTFFLILYIVVILGSSLYAMDTRLVDERLMETVKCLAIYLLIVGLASSPALIKRSVNILLFSGFILAILPIIQLITSNTFNEFWGFARIKQAHIFGNVFESRVAGPVGDPNFFAQVLLILVPLALYTARNQKHPRRRLITYFYGFTIVISIILTYSRGAGLALGCMITLVFLDRKINLKQVIIPIILVAGGVMLLPVDFAQRLVTIKELLPGEEKVIHPDSSFEKRKLVTMVALKMFTDNMILGVGAGNYTIHYDKYADDIGTIAREYNVTDARHYPHCLYLEIGAETGIIGLIVFILVLSNSLIYFRRARSRFMKLGDTYTSDLAKAFEISLVGYIITSLFLHGHFQRYLWMIFAFSTAFHGLSREGSHNSTCHEKQEYPVNE